MSLQYYDIAYTALRKLSQRFNIILCRNKKLSCRRETARRFVSLNILLNQSRSLKVIQAELLVRYSVSKNSVTLRMGYGLFKVIKNSAPCHPVKKNFGDMYNRLDRIPACDRWTDRQTSCHRIVRAMHTCCM